MNFDKAVFYTLAEGTGTSVSDALGNGPAGSVQGTTTNIWANAGGFTVSNSAGAAGDNAIKIQDTYIDELCRLDNLNGSVVLMYWMRQPQVPNSGTRYIMSYGDIGTNTDGAYSLIDQSHVAVYSVRGGATFEFGGGANTESIVAAQNNQWLAYWANFDVLDGRLVVSCGINGTPQRGSRLFNLESALPRVASNGSGVRLLGRGAGASGSANFIWGQTQVKRVFIGRVNGDQRHNIPQWAKQFYNTPTGIPDFMVA